MAHKVSPYEEQDNIATLNGEPVQTAIEIRFPETFGGRAWNVIQDYGEAFTLYIYNGLFVVTDASHCLDTNKVQWQGGSLEELEAWLEVKADELDANNPGWEEAYIGKAN